MDYINTDKIKQCLAMSLKGRHENSSQNFPVSNLALSTASPGKCEMATYTVLPDWKNKVREVGRHQAWYKQDIQYTKT